jgi:hypothetical protein
MEETADQIWELSVVQDYGQFYLSPSTADVADNVSFAVDAAIDSGGIAQRGDLTVVLSPHQNNFDMRLRIELFATAPREDLDVWQEAFEACLRADEKGLSYHSVDTGYREVPVPAGTYVARITGRGFVAHGWPGSTKPSDEWRIQLWPSQKDVPPRRLRAWDGRRSDAW